MSLQSITNNLANIACQEYSLDEIEKRKIKFGLDVIIGSIFKLIIFFSTFWILGVFNQSLIALCSSCILRSASGGYHCETYTKCLLTTVFFFSGIGLLSKILVIQDTHYYISTFALLLIIVFKAPVVSLQKQIQVNKRKYIMKTISSFILIFLIYISIKYNLASDLKNAILLGISFQVITLTGFGYKLFSFINKLNRKEV